MAIVEFESSSIIRYWVPLASHSDGTHRNMWRVVRFLARYSRCGARPKGSSFLLLYYQFNFNNILDFSVVRLLKSFQWWLWFSYCGPGWRGWRGWRGWKGGGGEPTDRLLDFFLSISWSITRFFLSFFPSFSSSPSDAGLSRGQERSNNSIKSSYLMIKYLAESTMENRP